MRKSSFSAFILFPAALISACQQSGAAQGKDADSPDGNAAALASESAAKAAETRGGQSKSDEDDIGRPVRTDEIEERADVSFSAYPLGEETMDLHRQGFKLADDVCGNPSDCGVWRDPDGVLHYLDEGNILTSKAVVAADFSGRSISALGIGTARDRATVLKNVSRYLLGAKPECLEAGKAGEGDGIASCTFEFSKIRVKLLFNSANRLIRADLYQVGGI